MTDIYSLKVMLGAERGPRLLKTWLPFSRHTHNWLQLICTGSLIFCSTEASRELVTLSSDRRLYMDLVAQLQEPVRKFFNCSRDESSPRVLAQQELEASTVLMRSGAQSLIISDRISGCTRLISQYVRISPLPCKKVKS